MQGMHINIIPTKLTNIQYSINSYTIINTPYNWSAFLAAYCFNSGHMSLYELIKNTEHIQYCFKFKKALLVPFSSLVLLLYFKQHYSTNNLKPFIYSLSKWLDMHASTSTIPTFKTEALYPVT